MPLSDNGKTVLMALITEVGQWVVIAGACLTLWIQQHNQHVDRINAAHESRVESSQKLDTIAREVKATQRPLVFGRVEEK